MNFPDYFTDWLSQSRQRCLLAEINVKVGGAEITRYLSSSGYVTSASDIPANTQYIPRLTGGFSFSSSLDLSGKGGNISYGDVELDNTDGELDSWLTDIWARRSINLYLGDPSWARNQFVQVFSGTVEAITTKDRYRIALKLRDVLSPLNGPINTATVGGDGDNKDSLLPLALGEIFNAEPLLISTSGPQVYRVSLGAVEDVLEVRDNGYPIAITKDLSAGTFTLTGQRYGQITCDIQGAKVGGQYRNDIGGLIEWVATTLGDGNKLNPANIDASALSAFRAAHPQPVGLWIPDRANRLETMQSLAATIGGTVTATALGLVKIVQFAYSTPSRVIGPGQMVGGSFAPTGRPQVRGAVQLAGCRNWSPQEKSSLTGSLVQANLPLLSDEWIYTTVTDNNVVTDYNQTESPEPEETLFVVESDMATEATRRLNIRKVPRTLFKFEGYPELLDLELGETVTLVHPLLNLENGAPALVTSLRPNYNTGKTDVEVLV